MTAAQLLPYALPFIGAGAALVLWVARRLDTRPGQPR